MLAENPVIIGARDMQHVQPPGHIGAGVDADTIWPEGDFCAGRMAMDNREIQLGAFAEKGLADPHQIGIRLLVKRQSGAYASMDKQIGPDGEADRQFSQEFNMLFGHIGAHCRFQFGSIRRALQQIFGVDAIGSQRFHAAEIQPAAIKAGRVDELQEGIVMITAQADAVIRLWQRLEEMADHLPRLRAAIDEIADADHQARTRIFGRHGKNAALGFFQQIQAAMNVANDEKIRNIVDIDADALALGGRRRRIAEIAFQAC